MKRLVATLSIIGILSPSLLPALAFDPNYIISDAEMTDPFALDRNQIQQILEKGYLADYKTADHTGVMRYAADIIWRAAQNHKISPKFLLVLLQKEQSLVEDDDPTQKQLDWAAGYAVCDDCSMSDPAIQRWKGFGKQVNSAAMQFSEGYLADIDAAGVTKSKYGPNITISIDGESVTPANAATASLYAYTPHIEGNENFAAIWDRWFGAEYPTGTLLQAVGQDGVYLIEYGYKRPITSRSALVSRFNADLIIQVNAETLSNYPTGTPISLPNYSLVQDENDDIYLLVDDKLRKFDSVETFHKIGFVEDQIVAVSDDERDAYDTGSPITTSTVYPTGKLLQIPSGAVFYVRDGVRQPIFDREILKANFSSLSIEQVQPVVIEQFREGTPVKFPDGYLVKSPESPVVYVISEGTRRAIDSEQTFLAFGWSWGHIVTASEDAISAHPLGSDITQGE